MGTQVGNTSNEQTAWLEITKIDFEDKSCYQGIKEIADFRFEDCGHNYKVFEDCGDGFVMIGYIDKKQNELNSDLYKRTKKFFS